MHLIKLRKIQDIVEVGTGRNRKGRNVIEVLEGSREGGKG